MKRVLVLNDDGSSEWVEIQALIAATALPTETAAVAPQA